MRLALPSFPRRAVHVTVLAAFAFAQPLFDLLAKTPEFFVARGSTRWDVVVVGVGLVLLPPVLLLLVEGVATLAPRLFEAAVHLAVVASLCALVAMQALKRMDSLPTAAVIVGAVSLGIAAAAVYARFGGVRTIVTVLAPAPLIFLALFLADSPVAKLDVAGEALARPLPKASTPVVVVVLDEIPTTSLMDERRRIDAGRYPNFAALARRSIWFRNAATVHEHTTEAVPAIVTGRYPRPGQLPLTADHPRNLFTLLGRRYGMHVFEPVTQLCPERLCERQREPFGERMRSLASDLEIVYLHLLLPDSLAERLPSVTDTWQDFGGRHAESAGLATPMLSVTNDEEIDRHVGHQLWVDQGYQFERFVAGIRATRKPSVQFLHTLLPHYPWRFLPSGREYTHAYGIAGLDGDTWRQDPFLVQQGWQRHLLQTGYTDRLLGRLLRRLRRAGLYDRALVVVTADHGVSFVPGERRRGVTPANVHDIAAVPLFVKLPGQRRGKVSDAHVETVDVLPTIAEVLGVQIPWRVDGVSALDMRGKGRREVVVRGRTGGQVGATFAAVTQRKYGTLARQLRLFGAGDWARVYRIGPHRELVGRPLARLAGGERADLAVELDGENLLRAYDPRSPLTPSHVRGRIRGAVPRAGLDLAIGVNGRVAAMARTYAEGGDTRFAAFVPPRAFRRGANDVDVFVVRTRPRGVALERIAGVTTAAFELAAGPNGETIRGPGGRTFRVVNGAVSGEVDDWYVERESIRFGGWAADVRGGRLPDRVLVFADGRAVYSGTTSIGRPTLDVVKKNRALMRSGFVVQIERELVGERPGSALRFFALSGAVASELAYADDFPWRPRR